MTTEDPTAEAGPTPRLRRRLGLRQVTLFAAALMAGTVAGAGGLSYAAIMTGSVNWHHGHRLGQLQHRVRTALDAVGATTVQEDKVHDILANGFTSLDAGHADRGAMRKQLIDLLRAPTIDRAAVEKLRAAQVANYDARSKTVMGMVLDSADQLSPDQRAALADKAEAMMARGPGGWHRGKGDHDGGPRRGGMGGDRDRDPDGSDEHGPDGARAPDGNPG
jgi:periplasmic protein CpxP/Spy